MSSTSSFLPPGLPFSAFSLTADFFLPAPGLAPPRPPVLLDFVGIFLTPFLEKIEQPQPAALNYPFDFAFFAHEAPGRCPLIQVPEILTAPRSPVAKVMVDLGVAGLAQTHQVIVPMRPALREGNDVMDFLHRSQPSFLQTHLAQRMRRSIAVTDAFPGSAVLLIYVRTAFVFVVLPAGGCFVFLAILTVREVGTAGVGAVSEVCPCRQSRAMVC